MEYDIVLLSILFFVALSAGIIDTIAGGGGLLTIPALFWAGIPPASALATNKMQSTFGTFTASMYFIRKKLVDLNSMKLMIAMTFIGSMIGSWAIVQIDPAILKKIIPFLLIAIGVFFLFSKDIGQIEVEKRISIIAFSFSFAFIVGFYDGFFGPGTGTFFTLAFVHFLGYTITQATGRTKVLNFITNFASFIFFIYYGGIVVLIGLIMGVGQVLGATIGAKLVMLKGQKIIRPMIIIISFIMSIKLLLE